MRTTVSEETTPQFRREVVELAVRYIDETSYKEVMSTLKKIGISKERRENLRVFRDAMTIAAVSDSSVGSYTLAVDILKTAKLL